MTFPTISTLPPAPQRTQDPNTFSATADAFVAALPTLVTEINTAGDFIDTNTILVGNAFQGTYSAGTTYSLGQSVLSAGKYYVSLVNSNTGNTPASSPSQWSELNMMAKQEALFPLETTALDTQTFNTSGNWTKPSTGTYAFVQLWGGGGSGGKGASVTAGGGGGGSYRAGVFKLSDLGSTVAVTVGAGGAAPPPLANGNVGGNTTFGTLLTAFGGGGGRGNGTASTSAGGGGGAGTGAAGATATSATGAKGGVSATPASILYYFLQNGPSIINFSSDSFFEPGGDGNSTAVINPITFFSGGGGGAGIFYANGGNGTPSFLGGGGGGGASGSSGENRTGGSGGTSVLGGNGGAGGTNAGSGTAGSQPAGGGGGSTGPSSSGAGGAGRCIVTVF